MVWDGRGHQKPTAAAFDMSGSQTLTRAMWSMFEHSEARRLF